MAALFAALVHRVDARGELLKRPWEKVSLGVHLLSVMPYLAAILGGIKRCSLRNMNKHVLSGSHFGGHQKVFFKKHEQTYPIWQPFWGSSKGVIQET